MRSVLKQPPVIAAPLIAAAAAFVAVAAGCWLVTAGMAADFDAAAGGGGWHTASFTALFIMWAVMMAAMMLPSFAPTALAFARLSAKRAPSAAAAAVCAFVCGYLLVWLAFSAAAAGLQQRASAAALLNDALYLQDARLRGALLIAAGVYQLSAFKFSCLRNCREPLFFFLLHWRGGAGGAWRMGARNGFLCLGCCWLLMLLLFAGGVMDLAWIVALTLYAAAEKILPLPPALLARVSGGALAAAGAFVLFV